MNKKIKQIAVFLGMLALGLTLTACSTNKDTKKATPKKPEKVSITYVQAPLNVPSIVEKANQSFEKKFKEKDIPVTYSTITSGADQTAALASGDIQFLQVIIQHNKWHVALSNDLFDRLLFLFGGIGGME